MPLGDSAYESARDAVLALGPSAKGATAAAAAFGRADQAIACAEHAEKLRLKIGRLVDELHAARADAESAADHTEAIVDKVPSDSNCRRHALTALNRARAATTSAYRRASPLNL